jgi:D-alanyl-D-alanine carboxypeptidase
MKKLAKEIGLKESTITSPHGLNGNISSALDIARLSAECFKIPLFYKIATTKRIPIKVRLVDEHGELANRVYLIENTNKLLGKGCLGGKTGSSIAGG